MSLVGYAGKDPEDTPFSLRLTGWEYTRQSRAFQAYQKFRSGMDTMELAEFYNVKEPTALRWISNERSKARSLQSPYEARL